MKSFKMVPSDHKSDETCIYSIPTLYTSTEGKTLDGGFNVLTRFSDLMTITNLITRIKNAMEITTV